MEAGTPDMQYSTAVMHRAAVMHSTGGRTNQINDYNERRRAKQFVCSLSLFLLLLFVLVVVLASDLSLFSFDLIIEEAITKESEENDRSVVSFFCCC